MTTHRQVRVRRALRLVVPALLLALAVVGPAGPAAAHATLVDTDPADGAVLPESPGTVTLVFDEPVTVPGGSASLFDAEGDTLAATVTATGTEVLVDVPDDLAQGSYLLSWRVVSGDGHPVAGSLIFSVGSPSAEMSGPPPPPESSIVVTTGLRLVQGVAYVSLLLAGGLLVFAAILLPRQAVADPVRARLGRLAMRSAVVAGAALAVVPLSVTYQLGLDLRDVVTAPVWSFALLRDPLLVAVLVISGLALALRLLGERSPEPRTRAVLLGAVAVAVAGPALVSHPRAVEPTSLMLMADLLHLGAGAIWLGGLVGLALALRTLSKREVLAAETLARFSTYAAGAVAVLTVTGSFMAWRIIGSWSGLVDTTYGRLLLVKIGLALVVVGVAAWNRLVLLPRVRDAAGYADRQRPARTVARSAAAEAGLLTILLLITGFLVNQTPDATVDEVTASTGAVMAALDEDVRVVALLTPGTRGRNAVLVQIQTTAGDPVEAFAAPEVRVRSESVDLGRVALVNVDTGTYRAEVVLPSDGPWQVQVSLRRSEFENPVATLEFPAG